MKTWVEREMTIGLRVILTCKLCPCTSSGQSGHYILHVKATNKHSSRFMTLTFYNTTVWMRVLYTNWIQILLISKSYYEYQKLAWDKFKHYFKFCSVLSDVYGQGLYNSVIYLILFIPCNSFSSHIGIFYINDFYTLDCLDWAFTCSRNHVWVSVKSRGKKPTWQPL